MAKITIDNLAGMTSRGFVEVGEKIDKGFTKVEDNFSEVGVVLKEMLTEIRELRKDGQETKELLKSLAGSLEKRVWSLEQKSGV